MIVLIFVFGAILGSFLNVCIYRIPREESIVYPSSHCPNCGNSLKWYELVPIFSFLIQKGKCRNCNSSISIQYPIIEALNGFIYCIVFYYYGFSIDFIFYSMIISILIVVSLIDYYHQIIPDLLVIIILISTIVHKTALYLIYEVPFELLNSVFGLLFGGVLFLIIALVSKGGMGGGDIKLISVLGFIFGFKRTILNILLSFIIGAFCSIFLLLFKVKGRKDAIPFGPFINIAFVITLFLGDTIISWYIYGLYF